jgi:major vault protein
VVHDKFNQAKLQHGEMEYRVFDKFAEPFPLYPGEVQVGKVKKLVVVPPDAALVIRATRKFDDYVAGDKWLFLGPATYIPRVEEEVLSTVHAIVIKKNQALKFRAEKKCTDALGIPREAGEEWLVRTPGAYLPQIDEVLVETLQAHTLTVHKALHLCALQTFTDVYNIKRRAGEEWLITTGTAETHVQDVHEAIIGTVDAITLTNRQYCVIVDPVVDGVQKRGTRELRQGETSFFLQPGEMLENGKINDIYVLGEDEAVLLQAIEPFVDRQATKDKAEEESSSTAVKREAGERWMIHGPREYIPPIQVEVLEIRKAIPLDMNEGMHVLTVGECQQQIQLTVAVSVLHRSICSQQEERTGALHQGRDLHVAADRGAMGKISPT